MSAVHSREGPRAQYTPKTSDSPAAFTGRGGGSRLRFGLWLAAIVLTAGVLRVACLFDDLWLDEIWSLGLTTRLKSAGQILSVVNDNNHPLNTLYLYLLGLGRPDWWYGLFSCVTGTATVAFAGLLGRRQFVAWAPDADAVAQRSAGLIAAVLAGGSYLLIHYSTEARGYAPAICFSLGAVYLLWRQEARACSGWMVGYWICAALALLAHAESAEILIAAIAWSSVAMFRRWNSWPSRLKYLLGWHLVPAVSMCLYYERFISRLVIGGGPKTPALVVTGETAAYLLGAPTGWGMSIALPLLAVAVAAGLILLIRRREFADAIFYFIAISAAVGPMIVRPNAVQLFPRYFLINASAALLVTAAVAGLIWNRGRAGRRAVAAMLVLFLVGSSAHTLRLIRYGQGQYRAAVRYLADHTPTAVISIGSDHDFRNFGVLAYFERELGPGRRFEYYPAGRSDANGPQWLFLHRVDGKPPPDPTRPAPLGSSYQLERTFRHAALSGWDWYLYRNVNLVPVLSDERPR